MSVVGLCSVSWDNNGRKKAMVMYIFRAAAFGISPATAGGAAVADRRTTRHLN
jgi:hypothetical protein